jgi:hypothetical protein
MLREINEAVASVMPSGFWDSAQFAVGIWIFIGVLFQRRASPRFQRANIICTGDAITVLAGQTGLAIIGLLGIVLALDALMPPAAPPRTLIVCFAAGFGMVQARVMYETLAKWARRGNNYDH